MKKLIKAIGIALLIFAGIVAAYLAYIILSYHRIEDHQILEITNRTDDKKPEVEKIYSILSYNIGFGAYSDDFSFFMDGGKYSRAYDKETVMNNTNNAMELIKQYQPDIILLQEVDTDSHRSYHVNQYEMIQELFPEENNNYAVNYDSPYFLDPVFTPHRASKSGMVTLSEYSISSAERRSIPVSTGIMKFFDLDRCYVVNRIPTENGKELVVYHVHLSAYTDDVSVVTNQISMLSEDMKKEYEAGNYIICGGDFNQDMLGNSPEIFGTDTKEVSWCNPFPAKTLPDGIKRATDYLTKEQISALSPSCRNADSPYKEGESFVTMVDGFLVSDNVEVLKFETIDTKFKYSDHNPIRMEFSLKK